MSDIDIARSAHYEHIKNVAEKIDIPQKAVMEYGDYKGKVSYDYLRSVSDRPDGKVVLVTSINPTPAGEGKTTTTVGLGDGLNRIGKKAAICLREPSLGPVFGVKGGAAGGGHAQVVPMEDINLHFTGDFHAITSAHNLLAAMIDNHIHHGNELGFDLRRVAWRRVIDMNDRALRDVTIGLGGVANGFVREGGFDITVASEVMAIFCLATDLEDLTRRLGKIVVGYTRDKQAITAGELEAPGPMSVLLRDALMPNIVQTLENNPAFIHGGPFANIAHGCNSVMATKAAAKLADYTVTEAGFGADLGAEKFFDIKCRKAGIRPNAAVVVATARALKMHGGVAKDDLSKENVEALKSGCANLARHVQNVKKFGLPLVVAINRFPTDTDAELQAIQAYAKNELGVDAVICTHFGDGGAGAEELANKVVNLVEGGTDQFAALYPADQGLWEKTRTIVREIYGANDIIADKKVRDRFKELEEEGYGHFPICMAKTANSFSTDPNLKGAPTNFDVPIREVRLSAGAEFVVVICGAVMTMPGLPSKPAANEMYVDDEGRIQNLS
ncbi:Formate-tetrahydrofolate ligase [Limimonas halophila]|uniref:Formate--tetrahydrofolate ligase n=1 Tax=Limimonas halophila TaxID=1082479 RepID=A0A1G7TQ43_9PROT|nr:formate--tetrahydrofolate ligase [Limimonas halophila]SDG37467.1 Formate-tetrahydrofolate ligase [Limimonas halophila]